MKSKVCKDCKKRKPISKFHNLSVSPDKKSYICIECRNEISRKYRRENREMIREKSRIKLKDPIVRGALILKIGLAQRHRITGVKYDKKTFTLPYLRDLLRNQTHCLCCQCKFNIKPKETRKPHNNAPSLDRVNTKKGYVKGNVALICWRCNALKSNATSKELRRIADWMDSF